MTTKKTKSMGGAIDGFADKIGRAVGAAIERHGAIALERLGRGAGKVLAQRLKVDKGPATPKSPAPVKSAPAKANKAAKPAGKVVAPPASPATKAESGGRAPKRTATEVDALADKLLAQIDKTPGLTMEKLAAAMKVTTAILQLPVSRLYGLNSRSEKVGEVRIETRGKKRATRYYRIGAAPADATPSAAPTAPVDEAATAD